jgi:hypothetical protein
VIAVRRGRAIARGLPESALWPFACGEAPPSLNRRLDTLIGVLMSLPAVGIILLFLVGFGVLNRYEFGRFD